MLYNLSWLREGRSFPPRAERARIERYGQNIALFEGDHFSDVKFRHIGDNGAHPVHVYDECARRISRVIGNFEDVISFPVLFNYQRLLTVKMADLVCGEYPNISGSSKEENEALREVRDYTKLDEKLYAAVLDMSRYGDAVFRLYRDSNGKITFTNWDPCEWYPIVSQDGTNTILQHCICWIENLSSDDYMPDYILHVQIHEVGSYEHRVYKMGSTATTIGKMLSSERVPTGLNICAIQNLKQFTSSNTVYGYDDYTPLDSILAEIMARVGQISVILDKHADPNITGPVSMLSINEQTGEYYLKAGKFFAVSQGEEQPRYMTWEGQLDAAFKQLEVLINQLYILSEMGSALLGDSTGGAGAISGTSMRFKMAGPLAKARRICNALTLPVRELLEQLTLTAEIEDPMDPSQLKRVDAPVPIRHIAIKWSDGLPDDPRENIEIAKLATGVSQLMPLDEAIMEYFDKSNEEAVEWISKILEETQKRVENVRVGVDQDVNKPGPQDGTGVNPQKKGSETGLNNPAGQQNRNQDTGK